MTINLTRAATRLSLTLACGLTVAHAGPTDNSLIIGASQEPSALEYLVNSQSVTREIMGWMYRDLTYIDLDGKIHPDMAAQLPTEGNGRVKYTRDAKGEPTAMTVRWTLKPDITWSDNRPITSEDFRLFYEIASDKRVPVISRANFPTAFRVIDAKNFEVTYSPINLFYQKGVQPGDFSNLPSQVWKPIWERVKASLEGKTPEQQQAIILKDLLGTPISTSVGGPPVVSGPFRFTRWTPGQSMIMKRNPTYWQKNPNGVQTVIYRFIGNTNTLQTALLAGQIDATSTQGLANSPATLKLLRDNARNVFNVSLVEGTAFENLIVNKFGNVKAVSDLQLDDPRTRQALLYAIDRKSIAQDLLGGTVTVTNTFVNPSSPVYSAAVQGEYAYNPTKARQLLAALGWKAGSDGILQRTVGGKNVKFVLEYVTTAGNAVRERNQLFIKDNLRKVGIDVKVNNAPASVVFGQDYFPRTSEGSWTGIFEAAGGGVPLLEAGNEFYCDDPATPARNDNVPTQANGYGGNNVGGWCNAAYDRAWSQARSETDPAARKALFARMQQQFAAELPSIPLYLRRELLTTRRGLVNYVWNGNTSYPSKLGWLTGWTQKGMKQVVKQPEVK